LILYVALIFSVSSLPGFKPPGPEFKLKDKIAHVAEYFVLGTLLFQGIGRGISRSKLATFLFLLAVGVSVGALDEIFQSYIPGREMSIHDWVADAVGVAAGAGIPLSLKKRFLREGGSAV
jgi:VanZ family protein